MALSLDPQLIAVVAHFAAFWVALLLYARRRPQADLLRPALGLGLGAALAHLGWVFFHLDVLQAQPSTALLPSAGYTVLLVPAGPLLAAAVRSSRKERSAFLVAALGTLPAGLAVARMGCVAVGCCHGLPTSLPWGVLLEDAARLRHPVPIYEIGAYLALYAGLVRLPPRPVPGAFLVGFGTIRLLLEPLRPEPPLGPTILPVESVAGFWVVLGAACLCRACATRATAPIGRAPLRAPRRRPDRRMAASVLERRS